MRRFKILVLLDAEVELRHVKTAVRAVRNAAPSLPNYRTFVGQEGSPEAKGSVGRSLLCSMYIVVPYIQG
jgi:hypothetical protein